MISFQRLHLVYTVWISFVLQNNENSNHHMDELIMNEFLPFSNDTIYTVCHTGTCMVFIRYWQVMCSSQRINCHYDVILCSPPCTHRRARDLEKQILISNLSHLSKASNQFPLSVHSTDTQTSHMKSCLTLPCAWCWNQSVLGFGWVWLFRQSVRLNCHSTMHGEHFIQLSSQTALNGKIDSLLQLNSA